MCFWETGAAVSFWQGKLLHFGRSEAKPPTTGITEELLFFCLFGVLWFCCLFVLFCFSFSCLCFGKIPSAELHPLSYILYTPVSPVSPKTSSHGRSHVIGRSGWQEVQDPVSWAAAPTQFTLEQLCQPKKTHGQVFFNLSLSFLSS